MDFPTPGIALMAQVIVLGNSSADRHADSIESVQRELPFFFPEAEVSSLMMLLIPLQQLVRAAS